MALEALLVAEVPLETGFVPLKTRIGLVGSRRRQKPTPPFRRCVNYAQMSITFSQAFGNDSDEKRTLPVMS
ncbi:hypothetical protein KEM54_005157 [Ascosphaera aggregata]|nr:hypothetical protein KEM54_005157 [Ascosphaera aggregata]